MLTKDLLYEVRDGVGYVTFNRPKSRNTLTFDMYEGLSEASKASELAAMYGFWCWPGRRTTPLASACDLRICDSTMKFGFPIARTLGNCLSVWNMNRLTALVGQGLVAEMTIFARLLSAKSALDANLVSEVLSDGAVVRARAQDVAQILTAHAPMAMWAAKEAQCRLRDEGPAVDDSDLISVC